MNPFNEGFNQATNLEVHLRAHPDELVKVEAAQVEGDVGEGLVHRVEGLLPTLAVVAGEVLLVEIAQGLKCSKASK